jgi:hypothetical protein
MEKTIYLTTAYLPPVQFFTKLYTYDKIYIECFEHYVKQTYRNRCVILAANGPLSLTVPIIKPENMKCPIKEIRISDHGNWRHLHWNAISSAYMNSPYFEYYEDDFRPFYEKKFEFLVDYNEELIRLICKEIDLLVPLNNTNEYKQQFSLNEMDARESIHLKKDFQDDKFFSPKSYYQVFADRFGFIPNLSIIDLLFNMGPESLLVLRDSTK